MNKFLAIFAAFVAVSASHSSEYHMMKKWMKHQAMESCLGEDVVRMWEVKTKAAEAKCRGVEAPELDLPLFKSPYRVVSGLLSAKPQPYSLDDGSGKLDAMMQKYMTMQIIKELREDSKDGGLSPFHRPGAHGHDRFRYRRQADGAADVDVSGDDDEDEEDSGMNNELALGDKLIEKLECLKKRMEAEVGNQTCVFREMGVLDADNQLDIESMLSHMDALEIDPWLKARLRNDKQLCYDYAQAIPQNVLDAMRCDSNLVRAKKFERCMCKAKTRSCMMFDTRKQVGDHFGSVEDLLEKTGLGEEELLPLVFKLMNEDHHGH